MIKKRLDILLVEKGLADTQAEAMAIILAGEVHVNGRMFDKAGQSVDESAKIEIRKSTPEYVSRGGIKLAHALSEFGIDVNGCVCVDIGASTGGFTDCLLKRGAKKVYAVDVGYGQLDFKLRNDNRVVVLEKTNIKNLDVDIIKDQIDIITIDVSFIGLEKVFPKVDEIFSITLRQAQGERLSPPVRPQLSSVRPEPFDFAQDRLVEGQTCEILALIKPQFEVPKGRVGKGGVVRDESLRKEAVEAVKKSAAKFGWRFKGVIESPIKGPKGNVEYLVNFTQQATPIM